jgi:uncharacterized membrane protein required for colicin V production
MNNIPRLIDLGSLVIIVINLATAAWRGFVKEILNLFGVIIAFSGATAYRAKAGVFLEKILPESIIPSQMLGFFVLFFGLWIVCKIITYFINTFLHASRSLTAANRVLGAFLGALKGAIIVFAVILPLVLLPLKQIIYDIEQASPETVESYPSLFKIPQIMDSSRAIGLTRAIKGVLFKSLGNSNPVVAMSQRVAKAASEVSVLRQAVNKNPEVAARIFESPKVLGLTDHPKVKELLSDPDIKSIIDKSDNSKQAIAGIMENKAVMSRSTGKLMDLLMDKEIQDVMGLEIDSALSDSGLERKFSSDGRVTIVDKASGGEMQIKAGKDGKKPEIKVVSGGKEIDTDWAESVLRRLLSDRKTLEKIYTDKKHASIAGNPKIKELINSEKVQRAVESENYSILFFDPRVRALVGDPQVLEFLKNYDQGKFK